MSWTIREDSRFERMLGRWETEVSEPAVEQQPEIFYVMEEISEMNDELMRSV